jgi:3-keto-5-aminohexanoate cleavage enzyme
MSDQAAVESRRRSVEIAPARTFDREAILEVMLPANMHRVPSPEMPDLDLDRFFVARVGERIVGAAGYRLLDRGRAKTTLLAVLPEHGGRGIGAALQDARLDRMHELGVELVTTNADRPATIAWYKRAYGYRDVGRLAKLHEFGDPDVDHWTTLELDLRAWAERRRAA